MNIRELFEKDIVRLAVLPPKNDSLISDATRQKIQRGELRLEDTQGKREFLDLGKINNLDGIVLTIVQKDYLAVSPRIWTAVYDKIAKTTGQKYAHIFAVGPVDEQTMRSFLDAIANDPKSIGGGVGAGFKDKLVKYLPEYGTVPPSINAIGAINFITKDSQGKLTGHNSDGQGFVDGLVYELAKYDRKIAGQKVVILGAGGTCSAITYSLLEHAPYQVVIVNRSVDKAEEIAKRMNAHFGNETVRAIGEPGLEKELSDTSIVINVSDKGGKGALEQYSAFGKVSTTPDGTPDPARFDDDLHVALKNMQRLPKDALIADVNLTAGLPMTLHYAKQSGYTRVQDGLEMVARQAVLQFEPRHGKLLPLPEVQEIIFRETGLRHA